MQRINQSDKQTAVFHQSISLSLPRPWNEQTFSKDSWGCVNFLVGPNATGKTRFAELLHHELGKENCRYLSSDRLSGIQKHTGAYCERWMSIMTVNGFPMDQFDYLKEGAIHGGFGGDAFLILEEKPDLLIKIEALLTQVFKRHIRLEWDSGRLVPRALLYGDPETYDLHKDECHGIKELIVILTHLYNDEHPFLIIDEPELHLHPQFQQFLLSEIESVASSPINIQKVVFLITHSPFMLDVSTPEKLASVLCFHVDSSLPSSVDFSTAQGFSSLLTRLNTHHKQLFFASCPVLVEGIFDLQILSSLQERRGVTMEGAGACFIDVGGKAEIVHYYNLMHLLGKNSRFIIDLDALFYKPFKRDIGRDERVVEALIAHGQRRWLEQAIGELEKILKPLIESVKAYEGNNQVLIELKAFLDGRTEWTTMRVATLIQLDIARDSLEEIATKYEIDETISKRDTILQSLENAGIHVLKKGFLENYLPSYQGSRYKVNNEVKPLTIERELGIILDKKRSLKSLAQRYSDLWPLLESLPGAPRIDYETAIVDFLRHPVNLVQQGVADGLIQSKEDIPKYLKQWNQLTRILEVERFQLGDSPHSFECSLLLKDRWGLGPKRLDFSEKTTPSIMKSQKLEPEQDNE